MNIIGKIIKKTNLIDEEIRSIKFVKTYWRHIDIIKSIYLNFKLFSLKDAFKLPILVSYSTRFVYGGGISLNIEKPYFAMILIGIVRISELDVLSEKTILTVYGKWVINGRIKIHPGAKILIKKNALLETGHQVSIGSCTKLVCHEHIKIGENVSVSWNSQIFDTDFHFLQNTNNKKIYKRNKTIIIGNNVFIGNHCTIGKGTILNDGSVVSCGTYTSGRISCDEENILIKGNPGEVVAKGFNIIGNGWFPEKEKAISRIIENNDE